MRYSSKILNSKGDDSFKKSRKDLFNDNLIQPIQGCRDGGDSKIA